jgi:serine protease inhibitor
MMDTLTVQLPAVPVFRADHPFLFCIRDRMSGAIVFLGRVADPTRPF